MSKKCFYENGLKFECQQCRYCCSVEPGFVFLTDEEVENIASYLALEKEKFIDTFCRKVGNDYFYRISLIEKPNNDCIFLTEKGCSIYPVRPQQCKTYPFWSSIVESQESWDNEAKYCPGINKGKIHSKEEIQKYLLK